MVAGAQELNQAAIICYCQDDATVAQGVMARYFIDTSDQDLFIRDETGHDFEDLAAAKAAAVDVLPDMARDVLPDGDSRTFLAIVRGENGGSLLKATLTLRVMALAPDLDDGPSDRSSS